MKWFAICAMALPLVACNTIAEVTKNPNCVVRVSGKTTFGGGVPVGEARYSAVCNAVKKTEPEPKEPAAPEDLKAP